MKHTLLLITLVILCLYGYSQTTVKPNIILIVLDDLNTYVSAYDDQPQVNTPGIQTLADNGTTFMSAYCNATECAPSRTSFLTGKLPFYTGVYNNEEYVADEFRDNFPEDKYILTFPEYLKDSADYFTVSCNKIFHQDQFDPDYDAVTTDVCEKKLSWNKVFHAQNYSGYNEEGEAENEDIANYVWASIDSSRDDELEDYNITDTAIRFIQDYVSNPGEYCNKPFFLGLGYHFPHLSLYVPENYFFPYYIEDFYADDFSIPYNHPSDTFPYNGVVMPPQPEPAYSDYDSLGYLGKSIGSTAIHNDFTEWFVDLDSIPASLSGYTATELESILVKSKMANAVMAYIAGIQYTDAQIQRFLDSLQLLPEILNNTVIILIGDHGFSLDQKKHWKKSALWETDVRTTLIIADYRNPEKKICQSVVSHADLFPTICELAQIAEPVLPSGGKYLDGKSIMPLLETPYKIRNRPVTTITKNAEGDNEGRCFPQYSVRSNNMHYIFYTSNSAIGDDENCNEDLNFHEEELYEIGIQRDIDPYEWNNLSGNPDYAIVKNYLSQWIPDSGMYLKSAYTLKMYDSICNHSATDDVTITATIIDTNGITLTGIPSGKHLVWWTNLGDDSSFTTEFNFSLADIPEIVSGYKTKILIYVALYDSAYSVIEGLEMQYVFIKNDPLLYPSFKVRKWEKKISIHQINYPSGTLNAIWDYGDGNTYTGFIPPSHIYSDYGDYTVKCNAFIGHCIETKEMDIHLDTSANIFNRVYPNPVYDIAFVGIDGKEGDYKIEIFSSSGVIVLEKKIYVTNGFEDVPLDFSKLHAGSYFLKITGDGFSENHKFIKATK